RPLMSSLSRRSADCCAALFAILFMTIFSANGLCAEASRLNLRPKDHICFIGNALADRMQHEGTLEALLDCRFPEYQLVIRNLGYTGDELNLRLRSAGFGSPDDHLAFNKA